MEHEISGHSRKVYKIWKNPALPFWKKLKEIAIEILIIVFAVSLAAFLEREREHGHEQKQVKEFLLGLKDDLQADIKEMNEDKKSYDSCAYIFKYIARLKPGQLPSRDTLDRYTRFIFNTTGLIANDGRYQGFKSSGKISTIENRELQNDILDLYQENISLLLSSTDSFTKNKQLLFQYLADNVKRNPDGSDNFAQVMGAEKAHNTSLVLGSTGEIRERYDAVISKSKKIITEIDHEYPQ
jgi:hypothetical protein